MGFEHGGFSYRGTVVRHTQAAIGLVALVRVHLCYRFDPERIPAIYDEREVKPARIVALPEDRLNVIFGSEPFVKEA